MVREAVTQNGRRPLRGCAVLCSRSRARRLGSGLGPGLGATARWADDDAEELVGAAVGGAAGAPVSGAAGGAVVGAAAAGGAVAIADAGTVGGAGPDAARWIPARGWTGEGEVFAAGFLHRDRWDDVPAGAGFAAGGFMDDLAAGPLLATLISEATAPTLSAHTAATTATRTTGSAHPAAGSASADPVATADSTAATTGRTPPDPPARPPGPAQPPPALAEPGQLPPRLR